MRVAQFVHRYPPAIGGAEAWAERLSKHLIDEGHSVAVWTTTAVDLSAFMQRGHRETAPGMDVVDGVAVRRYRPEFRFPGRRLVFKALSMFPGMTWRAMTQPWAPLSLRMWRDAGHETRVGVVHAIAFPYASIIHCAMRLARRAKVPFIVTPFLHLGDPDNPNDPIRRAYTARHLVAALRQANRVIVQTPTEARTVEGLGVSADRIVLQGLGVNPAECTGGDREAVRRAWGVRDGEVVIGHLANLSMEKGTLDLMCAAEELRRAGVPVRVVLAGPEMPVFQKFRRWTGRTDWEIQLGVLNEQQKRDFFAGIDVLVLPSISDSFGLVFLEAWANAVPVVGYRAGGVVDVIRHEQDGLLVKCGDLQGLAAAIRRLVDNAEIRKAWGRAGQERISGDFRWEDKLQIASDALTKW
jgi:glycosyltransferase involved in cell wall biosynthesis